MSKVHSCPTAEDTAKKEGRKGECREERVSRKQGEKPGIEKRQGMKQERVILLLPVLVLIISILVYNLQVNANNIFDD